MGSKEKQYAYWLPVRGPEMMSGVELYVIEPDVSGPFGFFSKCIDWWPSRIRYEAGEPGFHYMTNKLVYANYENIVIFDDMNSAVKAWRNRKTCPEK